MLRFFLDGTEVNPPKGASSIAERLYTSEELGCNLSEITGTVTFLADERDYIYDAWVDNNCDLIEIKIQKQDDQLIFRDEFTGFIFLSDVIFKDNENEVECEIVDNSFIAKINNNKDLKMNLGVALSKNGIDISSYYTTNSTGSIFTYSPGGGTYNNRLTISVYDSFAALIAFMTDGEVEFRSNFFDYTAGSPTEGNQYYLVTGLELFTGNSDILPTISFEELFKDLRRCYNLRIGIEVSDTGKPILRIEPKSYFRSTSQIQLDDVKNIKFQRKPGNSYDKILVGNELSDEANPLNIFNFIWNTWKTKEYLLQGQCNEEENNLNLRFETLCADVRVQDLVGLGTITQDEDVFLYAEPIFNGGADEFWNPFELYAAGINYNNKNTRNGLIIDRWSDDIYSNVAQFSYFLNDIHVERTTQQTIGAFTDVIFDDDSTGDNFDHGNTYNNATGIYTCIQTGTYRQRFRVELLSTGGSSTFTLGIAFGFAAGPQGIAWFYPGQETAAPQTLGSGESFVYELEYEAPLLEGTDTGGVFPATISVQVNKTAGAGTLTVEPGSTFEIFTAGSGVFREFSANNAYSKEINGDCFISSEDWESIKENRDYLINLQGLRGNLQGYGQDIQRNVESGKASVKLLGRMS